MINALVLAGRENDRQLRAYSEVAYEALIDVGGRPMVSYVLDALVRTNKIEKTVVVGPLALASMLPQRAELIPASRDLATNVLTGLASLPVDQPILILTSDIPLITSEILLEFMDAAMDDQYDLYYPIVAKEDNDKRYPHVKRTYVKLTDGTFTGGNLFFLRHPQIVTNFAPVATEFAALRKQPLKMAGLLGFTFVSRLLVHRLSIAQVEKRFETLFGVKGRAVIMRHPEVGIDIDKPSDLILCRAARS